MIEVSIRCLNCVDTWSYIAYAALQFFFYHSQISSCRCEYKIFYEIFCDTIFFLLFSFVFITGVLKRIFFADTSEKGIFFTRIKFDKNGRMCLDYREWKEKNFPLLDLNNCNLIFIADSFEKMQSILKMFFYRNLLYWNWECCWSRFEWLTVYFNC